MTTSTPSSASSSSAVPLVVPRGELFADPAAGPVFEAVKSLDPASQHDLLAALRERLAIAVCDEGSGYSARARRAVAALREAADMLGRSPSVSEYTSLREQHPERDWPGEAAVRRAIGNGSWNHALRTAHLDALPDGDVLLVEHGPAYTREEVLEAVRECADWLGRLPSLGEYRAWANHPDQRRRPRTPRSQTPFDRLFGGWANTITTLRTETSNGGGEPLVRKPGTRRWEQLELIAFIRHAGERLGRPPATTDIKHLRQQLIDQATRQGREPAVPSYAALRRLGATWDQVLQAAGLPARGGRHVISNHTPRSNANAYPTPTIHQALVAAYAEIGDPFTVRAYRHWRQRRLAEHPDSHARVPSYEAVRAHTGGWDNATRIARGNRQ